MHSVTSNFTVADYCAAMSRGDITVNKDYQRSDQVWPQVARSYLIETILKGFPIPKLYLYQRTDTRSKKTIKEIVDGQQRSKAILDFFNDNFRLSKSSENEEIQDRKYSELDQEQKHKFLDYGINVDLFVSATSSEVVEVFRRMNSYTVPLNHEEQRHATYQGKFKWFINDVAEKLEAIFLKLGVFKEKQLVRMQDNKLLTELCHSFYSGISTTNKQKLDSMYRDLDTDFPEKENYYGRLIDAFSAIESQEGLHDTLLMKPYLVYSLVQAITHISRPVKRFQSMFTSPRLRSVVWDTAIPNLTALADTADADQDHGKLAKFVRASREKTNVRENRKVRFKWMCKALVRESL